MIQEDEYYSFELRKPTGGYDYSNNNRYLYHGKEIQTDLTNQYDYGARFYDPVIGRWTSVDKLAEHPLQIDNSPYAYTVNNPIRYNDPDGNCGFCLIPIIEGLEALATVFEGVTATQAVGGAVFVEGATAITLTTIHRSGPNIVAPRDATIVNNPPTISKPNIVKANGTFGDKKDTKSKTEREALRKAKDRNGVPRSQQPGRTIKPNTPEGDAAGLDSRNVVQHEYTNSDGQKVVIRRDKPHEYGDGGKGDQGDHYNAGQNPQQPKDLNQHHDIKPAQ